MQVVVIALSCVTVTSLTLSLSIEQEEDLKRRIIAEQEKVQIEREKQSKEKARVNQTSKILPSYASIDRDKRQALTSLSHLQYISEQFSKWMFSIDPTNQPSASMPVS